MMGKNSGQIDLFNSMIFETLIPKNHLLGSEKAFEVRLRGLSFPPSGTGTSPYSAPLGVPSNILSTDR